MLDFEDLMNAVMRRVERVVASTAQDRHATVASVNPNNHSVRVLIQPEGILTGWIPCGSVAVGPASMVCPPSPGDQVLVSPAEGDADSWRVTSRVFDTSSPPQGGPVTQQPVQPGELGLFTAAGYLHMTADGKVWLGTDLHVKQDLYVGRNIFVEGGMTALGTNGSGDIADRHGTLDRLRGAYDGHSHPGVVQGGGHTGTTSTPDAE